MRSPEISVIVPVYNAEKYLNRCIDSILAQTYTDFELLLIDDGSTDNSGKICDEYAEKDTRIRVFHKENGGASSARNVGLDNACGEWIAFADSDDYVFPEWLSIFIIAEDIDLSCQGMITDKPLDKNIFQTTYSFEFYGNTFGFLQHAHAHQILGYLFLKIFKNDYIKANNLRFDETIKLQEDDIFVLQYLKYCTKIKATINCGYKYFVPDWGKKHNLSLRNHIDKHIKILKVIRNIPNAKRTDLFIFHQAMLAQCLINEFSETKNYEDLRLLKSIHIENPNASEMNVFTKWILIHDRTLLLSSFTIRMVNFLGKKIRNLLK